MTAPRRWRGWIAAAPLMLLLLMTWAADWISDAADKAFEAVDAWSRGDLEDW